MAEQTTDRIFSLLFVSDTELNEISFNTVAGSFLAQATLTAASGGAGGGVMVGTPLEFFGDGFNPMLPSNAPTTVTPLTPLDLRPEIPGLYA